MLFPTSTSGKATSLLSLLLFGNVVAQAQLDATNTTDITGFPPCDALISANLSHAVHLASSPLYPSLVANGSYAPDTRKEPWCFVLPSTTAEVSETLKALRTAGTGAGDWHVAIRSGGHGAGNQNNVVYGVTIDLTHLNTTTYNAETNIASVGTGARWGSVYAELEGEGVQVAGGREGDVGVGGLLLGGGVSWYLQREGMSCDNVVNYEVVLSSGEVVNANASSNADLWLALKGGSSNFGIVTRFDLNAFPTENLFIQEAIFSSEHSDELIDAVSEFTTLDQSFGDNALIFIMTYNPELEDSSITVRQVNTLNKANSTAYNGINRIPTMKQTSKESISLPDAANSTQLSGEFKSAGGGTLTLVNDPRVLRYCVEEYDNIVEQMKALLGPQNFTTLLDFQPFPSYVAEIGINKGGNMLGLERDSRNKILYASGVTMLGDNVDEVFSRVQATVTAMNERIVAYSKSIESATELIYLPYAKPWQDVLSAYGAANVEHIRNVAEKYDPRGFFQSRVPGGFKISRVH